MSNYDPLVSIVVPVYNAEKYIDQSIQSIKNQNYKNIEIIVIDDASTDKSVEAISKYSDIKFYKNETNIKECKTCNNGYSYAKGKYLVRVTGDDSLVNPNLISEQVETMEKYNLDWCYANINLMGKTLEESTISFTSWIPLPLSISRKWFYIFDNVFLKFPNLCYIMIGIRCPMNTNSVMIRADSYKKYLTWCNKYGTCCDFTLYRKIFLNKLKGRAIHTMGAFWRVHDNQLTGSKHGKSVLKSMREEHYEENSDFPKWMKIFCKYLKRRVYLND